MSDAFTTEHIVEAVKALEAANVPPIRCPNCGAGWYALMPTGWTEGDPVTIQCDCLAVLTVVGPTRCGGEMLGKPR